MVRLPDVHGEIQRVSKYIKTLISNEYIFKIPKTPAWIVFINTIQEMIMSIIDNKEKSGRYTLVNDEIYWSDLLEYFAGKINKKAKYINVSGNDESYFRRFKKCIYNWMLSKRDIIRGNLPISREFEAYKKIQYGVVKANNAYKYLEGQKIYNGLNIYKGILPGKRFKNLTQKKNIIFQRNSET